jgi:hypothetical protein
LSLSSSSSSSSSAGGGTKMCFSESGRMWMSDGIKLNLHIQLQYSRISAVCPPTQLSCTPTNQKIPLCKLAKETTSPLR